MIAFQARDFTVTRNEVVVLQGKFHFDCWMRSSQWNRSSLAYVTTLWRHFHYLPNAKGLSDFIKGINRFSNLTAWAVWVQDTYHAGNKTKYLPYLLRGSYNFKYLPDCNWEIKLHNMGISQYNTQAVTPMQGRHLSPFLGSYLARPQIGYRSMRSRQWSICKNV